ncbi:DUF4340 domain-containing protein [bacterium]|nr:DUF4340 domain-containing protein [bacterium]
MNEWPKTLAFAAAAALTAGAALTLDMFDRRAADKVFDDQGQPFFAAFSDPLMAQAMEVVEYKPDTATVTPFQVQQKNGKWSIPSHYDYPAEAKDRLAKTAAGVIDLKKDTIRSDDVADHEALGVIDPLDTKTSTLKGRGKRVTLRKQADGEILADLIIGNEVKDRPGQRFVRLPGSPRTYGVNVNVDLSTRFADWIRQDLLDLDKEQVRKIVIDRHKADPARGVIVPGEVSTIRRNPADRKWSLDSATPDETPDVAKIDEIVSALAGIKILGVRPKPAGLTKDLEQSTDGTIELKPSALMSLQSRGFYKTRTGSLVSNQGEIQVGTDQGVVYVLRFGEVTVADGEDLSAGTSDDADQPASSNAEAKSDNTEKAEKPSASGTEGRFLFVTTRFDPELVVPPRELDVDPMPALPGDPFQLPDSSAITPGFETDVAKEKQDRAEKERKRSDELEKKREEGRKRAQELSQRYAGWYYVVPAGAFGSIAVDDAKLLKSGTETPSPLNRPQIPPNFGLPGLPGQ